MSVCVCLTHRHPHRSRLTELWRLLQDLPIGILNLTYLVRTVQECADTGADRICDLNPTKTTMLVLATLTSAGMLGFKAARMPLAHPAPRISRDGFVGGAHARLRADVEVIRMKWEEHKRLQRERAELLAALEASLSPELTLTVKQIFDQQDFERNTIRDGDLNGAVEELIRHRRATSVATQVLSPSARPPSLPCCSKVSIHVLPRVPAVSLVLSASGCELLRDAPTRHAGVDLAGYG